MKVICGEWYYTITGEGKINIQLYEGDSVDIALWSMGNGFKTEDEAIKNIEPMLEKFRQIKKELEG